MHSTKTESLSTRQTIGPKDTSLCMPTGKPSATIQEVMALNPSPLVPTGGHGGGTTGEQPRIPTRPAGGL